MKKPAIQYAQLLDVIGQPRSMDGILFVPALLEFDEPADSFHQTLENYLQSTESSFQLTIAGEELNWPGDELKWHCDIWSRARIPALFHFQPPLSLGNTGNPLNVGFLAISTFAESQFLAVYPFACVNEVQWQDYGGSEVGILFSRHCPSPEIRDQITKAFWRLLLQSPEDLTPFADYNFFRQEIVGFTGQHLFAAEGDGGDSDGEGIDSHHFLHGEHFLCYDCDGCGIEYEFPYTEDCATCGGHGYITWRFRGAVHSSRWDETAW